MSARHLVQVVDQDGYWSVFVDGVRCVDRESYQVAANVVECLRDPNAAPFTESREVADAILKWRAGW